MIRFFLAVMVLFSISTGWSDKKTQPVPSPAPSTEIDATLTPEAVSAGTETLQETPVHAINVRGLPKYPENFTHFSCHNPDAPKGGTIRIPVIGTVFDTLNPFLPTGLCAKGLGLYSYLPFDTLMERSPDEPFTMYPRLAKAVFLSSVRDKIVFYLDERARFHDGTPVEAKDVIFTFQMLAEHGSPTRRLMAKKIKSLKALDPYTVEFIFELAPDGGYDQELPFIIAMMPVLSKNSLKGKDFSKTGLDPLMGSGPYRVAKVLPGQLIEFQRVKNYWGQDLPALKGVYNFDTLIYEYFGTDTVGFEAFKAGALDHWTETNPGRWANEYTFPAATDGRVIREILTFRNSSIVTCLVFNTHHPLLKDPITRQALGLLLDLEWMNKNLFDNSLVRTESFFGDTEFAAHGKPDAAERSLLEVLPSVPPEALKALPEWPITDGSGDMRPQIQKAHQLLEAAGWVFKENSWVNREGQLLVCKILLKDPKSEKLALAYQRVLAKAGIKLDIQTVDSAQYQKRVDAREFDMIFHIFGTSLSPGAEQKLYWLSAFARGPSRNYAGIESPAIDAVCDVLTSAKDQASLVTAMHVLDRLLRQGYYMRPLYDKNKDRVAYWKHLAHPPLNGLNLPSIYAWWSLKTPAKG